MIHKLPIRIHETLFKKLRRPRKGSYILSGTLSWGPTPPLVHTTLGDCIVECIVDNKEQAITGRTTRLGEEPETQSGRNRGGQPILR